MKYFSSFKDPKSQCFLEKVIFFPSKYEASLMSRLGDLSVREAPFFDVPECILLIYM